MDGAVVWSREKFAESMRMAAEFATALQAAERGSEAMPPESEIESAAHKVVQPDAVSSNPRQRVNGSGKGSLGVAMSKLQCSLFCGVGTKGDDVDCWTS